MKKIIFISLLVVSPAFAWTTFRTSDPQEIRNILRYHRDLLDDYLMEGVANPGTTISEAIVRYIKVVGESGGEKVYTCELNTELYLSSGKRLQDKVEVEKKCEHVF